MWKIISCLLLGLSFPFVAYSQECHILQLFSKSFEIVNEKGKKDSFKGQILKGKRNGMGFLMQKKKYLYAGDFYRNDMTGCGILFAIENNYIENCDGCTVYVGNLHKGMKTGFGTCYTAEGNVLYQGQFKEDKPIDQYPTTNLSQQKYFSRIELTDGDIFLGEINEEDINGYGVIVFNNGDLWLSNFKDGDKNGVGLYLLYNGEWETLNFSKDDCNTISSSTNYRNIDIQRKEIFKSSLSEAMGYFAMAANKVGEVTTNIQTVRRGEPVYTGEIESNEAPSSNSSLQSQYMQWERRAIANYNSLTNLGTRVKKDGKDVSGTNGQSLNGGNYVMQQKALRQAQSEMQRIRNNAIRQGINIQQSRYETIKVTY